ncbi:MAG: DUF4157 domain-containing protein [Anaerolineae bacterium]
MGHEKQLEEKQFKPRRDKVVALKRVEAELTQPRSPVVAGKMQNDPRALTPENILALQHTVGNRAVRRMIQTKLVVGAAHDAYEQEADRVANQVMSAPAAHAGARPAVQRAGAEEEQVQTKPLAASITPLVQRAAEEKDEDEVQTKRADSLDSFETGGDFQQRLEAAHGGGSPLPGETREFMESRFGTDFSGVRVHSGGESAQLNREVSAQAFTHGSDIYLGEGKTDLQSNAGKQLLAHELTHVVQQTGGVQRQVDASQAPIQRLALTDAQWTHIAKGEVRYEDEAKKKKPYLVGYHWTGDKKAVAEIAGSPAEGPNELGIYTAKVQTKEEHQTGNKKEKIQKAKNSTFWPNAWSKAEIEDVIKNGGTAKNNISEVSNKTTKKEAVGMMLFVNPDSVFPVFEAEQEDEGKGKGKGRGKK